MTTTKAKIVHPAKRRAQLHEKIATSIVAGLSPKQTLTSILEQVSKTFSFGRCLVFFYDQNKGVTRILGHRGFAEEDVKQISFADTAAKHAITPMVVKTGKIYFTANIGKDDKINPYWREKLHLQGPLLAVPLKVGKSVCGALVINDPQLTKGQARTLIPFINDLAITVTVIEQAERLRGRERIIGLMREVQSSFSEAHQNEKKFLNKVARSIAEVLNAQLCAIYRPLEGKLDSEPHEELFERKGAFGYPESILEDIRSRGRGKGKGLTNHILAGQRLNVPHVQLDRRWSGKEAAELKKVFGSTIRAFFGLPMKDSLNNVIGAVTLTRSRVSVYDGLAFSAEDTALVEAICTAVSAILEMIDTKKRVERHHAELDALFNAVSEKLPEEVSVVDTDFTIKYVNPAKRDKFKHDRRLLGRKCYKVYEKRDHRCPDCPIQTAMTNARSGDLTPVHNDRHFGRPRKGKAYQAYIVASAITDSETREVLGGVEVVRDLTKEAHQVDTKIGHGAHAIRTALDSIRTRLDTMKIEIEKGRMPNEDTLKQQLERLTRLVNDGDVLAEGLLRWTREVEIETHPHDIRKLICRVLSDCQVSFEIKSEPRSKRWIINCDEAKLRVVFHELIQNAKKAVETLDKTLRVTIKLAPWIEENQELGLRISFGDNGPGVPISIRRFIFERFYSTFGGYGIGLHNMSRIIRAHEGLITLSDEGPGAIFEIYLPVHKEVEQR